MFIIGALKLLQSWQPSSAFNFEYLAFLDVIFYLWVFLCQAALLHALKTRVGKNICLGSKFSVYAHPDKKTSLRHNLRRSSSPDCLVVFMSFRSKVWSKFAVKCSPCGLGHSAWKAQTMVKHFVFRYGAAAFLRKLYPRSKSKRFSLFVRLDLKNAAPSR